MCCIFSLNVVDTGTLHPDSYPFVTGRSDTAVGPCRCVMPYIVREGWSLLLVDVWPGVVWRDLLTFVF